MNESLLSKMNLVYLVLYANQGRYMQTHEIFNCLKRITGEKFVKKAIDKNLSLSDAKKANIIAHLKIRNIIVKSLKEQDLNSILDLFVDNHWIDRKNSTKPHYFKYRISDGGKGLYESILLKSIYQKSETPLQQEEQRDNNREGLSTAAEETKLKLPQIALIYVYSGQRITRKNGNEIAAKYGHKSGDNLYNRFTKYSNRQNRIAPEETKTKTLNKIKLIESIIPHVSEDDKQKITDELTTLKAKEDMFL